MIAFKYADNKTVIHYLNPFCKMVWILGILVFCLIFDNPLYISLLFISTLPVVAMAKIHKEWFSLMKLTFFLCIAIIVINAIVSNEGKHVLVEAPFEIPEVGTPMITLEALFFGAIMCIKLLTILTAFTVLTFTIHPDDLMLSMIKLKLPYKSVLITSLTTRFIPTLLADTERITDAQRCRGVDFTSGNLIQKAKKRMNILAPLLSNSLDRAIQIAEAMEAKAFGANKSRTYYKQISFSLIDWIIMTLFILTLGFGIYLRTCGYGRFDYYPSISELSMNQPEVIMLVSLILMLLSMIPLAMVKRRTDLD